jgi:hypothetical protein
MAAWFPAQITTSFGFECRLTDLPAPADFAFSCLPARGMRIVAGVDDIHLSSRLLESRVWQAIQRFSRVDTKNVDHLWLELDSDGREEAEVPVPAVFLAIPTERAHDLGWLPELLSILEHPLSAECLATLQRCTRFISPQHTLFYLGLMFSRSVDRVRLVFRLPETREGIDPIPALGLAPEHAEALEGLSAELAQFSTRAGLSIDVGETIGTRVGIEYKLTGHLRNDQPRWAAFLGHLVARGACSEEAREAVLAWPGASVVRLPHLLWPTPLVRKINHLKIVQEAVGPAQAKAYLLARYDPERG